MIQNSTNPFESVIPAKSLRVDYFTWFSHSENWNWLRFELSSGLISGSGLQMSGWSVVIRAGCREPLKL